MALTDQAHALIGRLATSLKDEINATKSKLIPAIAIDATCGNGHDTEFLLECGFAKVLGFDIQAQAIRNTRERCKAYAQDRIELIQTSHDQIAERLLSQSDTGLQLKCAMFNLGYLPSGDKHITTQSDATLAAIEQTAFALASTGIITIMCYPGHPNGQQETANVIRFLETLAQREAFTLTRYDSVKASPTTPLLLALEKT